MGAVSLRRRESWSPRRWVVLGGTGFVGGALVDHLRSVGAQVSVVPAPRLQMAPSSKNGADVWALAASHEQLPALTASLTGADVVVNAAGLAVPDSEAGSELYGANALLPAVVARAAEIAGVPRYIHLSTAAVQGRRGVLDSTPEVSPFSPYSHSKALGERALLSSRTHPAGTSGTDVVIIRATSVQGAGRSTTRSLQKIARSALASVATPGTQPSVVSSIFGLVNFVHAVGKHTEEFNWIQVQPWEGLSVSDVLRIAGGKEPRRLPARFCRLIVGAGAAMGNFMPVAAGLSRRLEMMWFGQSQEGSDAIDIELDPSWIQQALSAAAEQ